MTNRKLSAWLLPAALLALASCSNDIEPTCVDGTPVPARVTASIGAVQSRASGTSWDAGDRIGISGAGYSNIAYITDENDKFTPSEGDGIFFPSTDEFTFSAYYPYNDNNGTISVSTSNQQNQEDFDFLFATGATASAAKPTISFTGINAFRHRMTRLDIKIEADANTGFSFTDIQKGSYTLSGIKHNGTFDATDGKAEAAAAGIPTAGWNINDFADDSFEHRSYSLILFPQTGAELTFNVVIGGREYEATLTPALEAGYIYRYNITVKNTELVVGNCSIEHWGSSEHSGEATIIPPIGDKAMELADVGDFYFYDGSFADKGADLTPEQANACIGIVFHKGYNTLDESNYTYSGIGQERCHSYVVALTDVNEGSNDYLNWGEKDGQYSMDAGTSTEENDWSGYKNQKAIEYFAANNEEGWLPEHFEAAYWCGRYGTGDSRYAWQKIYAAPENTSGWFLPSCGQLKSIYSINRDNENLLKNQMEKVKSLDTENIKWFSTYWFYWSSSEDLLGNSNHAKGVGFYYGNKITDLKNNAVAVRAVLAF